MVSTPSRTSASSPAGRMGQVQMPQMPQMPQQMQPRWNCGIPVCAVQDHKSPGSDAARIIEQGLGRILV